MRQLLNDKLLLNDVEWMELARELFPGWDGFIQYASKLLTKSKIGSVEVCDEFGSVAFGSLETEQHAWSALLGDKKRSAPTPEEKFTGLLRILVASGFKRVYLLVDEMEDLLLSQRLTSRQRVEYLAALRLLLDKSLKDLGVVLAGVEQAWGRLVSDLPALTGRSSYRILIPRLDKKSAPALVVNFLNTAREPKTDSIEPFAQEAIEAALKPSEAIRRRFIAICYQATEIAADEGLKKISKREVEQASKRLLV